MPHDADICLIVEGGYPYTLGGVASWMDAQMRASPDLRFHVIAIGISSQPRIAKYQIADNLAGITDVILDQCPRGRPPSRRDVADIHRGVRLMSEALSETPGESFVALIDLVRRTGLGQDALLDSKAAWAATEEVYRETLPDGSFIDFFWSWRFLARSLLAVVNTPLPRVRVFHAVATGFAGIVGAYAKHATGRPLVVTEHGIYTKERRIDLGVAEWLHDSGSGGFAVAGRPVQLRDVWLGAFAGFSRISYDLADAVTTQYGANQQSQRADGAAEDKLLIIQNGIDVDRFGRIERSTAPRPPTVLMIARIVPIKDIRTFITAVSFLRDLVPDVLAVIIGPEDEDPSYAAGCRALVDQLGLEANLRFLGRVPEVTTYLGQADVIALSSISEAQPIALLEAAATGLPAVTTDVGSCREIIEGFEGDPVVGRGGYVVEACNPKAMAQALAAILLDADLRDRMGQVMLRRIPSLYHKERIRKLYEELYDRLDAEGPVRRPQLA